MVMEAGEMPARCGGIDAGCPSFRRFGSTSSPPLKRTVFKPLETYKHIAGYCRQITEIRKPWRALRGRRFDDSGRRLDELEEVNGGVESVLEDTLEESEDCRVSSTFRLTAMRVS